MKFKRKYFDCAHTILQTIILSLLGSSTVLGQKTPVLPLDKQSLVLDCQQQTLAQIVAVLSREMKRNIVIDDEPSDRKVDLHTTTTAKESVEAVAAAFDYAWAINKHDILVMHKSFKKSDTLPQMNLPEIRQTAKTICDILNAFHCAPESYTWGLQCQTLAQSFTAIQREQLLAGKILHLADLNQQQGSLLQQIVLNHSFSYMLDGWGPLIRSLDEMPANIFVLRKSDQRPDNAPDRAESVSGTALEQIFRDANGKEIEFKVGFVPVEKKS